MTAPDSRLAGHLRTLEQTRKKIEGLFRKGLLVRRDVERVYEGLYLDAVTSFEAAIEDLFIRIITNRASPTGVTARVSFRSSQIARDIMLGGERKYLDWFPYNKTEQRAKAFLRGGQPFTRLSSTQRNKLDDIIVIRNAIAHKSSHSKKKFQNLVNSLPLHPREKTPAGFLRSRIDVNTTRYQFYSREMINIIRLLCR